MGAFKAYDIRGIYGKDVTDELAYRIGFFLPKLLNAGKVLVGRDVRLSSEKLFKSTAGGIMDSEQMFTISAFYNTIRVFLHSKVRF